MAIQHTQVSTNKQEFRWGYRKKGKDVLNLCRQLTYVVTLAGGLMVITAPAYANPTGGTVVGGTATISTSGTTTTINQSSTRAIIDWNNFDIAAGETTQFIQPSTSAIALNRVVNSQQASMINGNLTANGHVLVINPNGVLIGPGGNIDVGGFVASTADIDNTRFMTATGAMEFDKAGKIDATVENKGRITIHDEGLGLLVAPSVRNDGIIEGNMARLQMGAGDTFGVDLYGDGLLHLAVGQQGGQRTIKAENAGTIVANAGKVVMTAAAASNVVNSVINTTGVIEAKGLVNKGGEIILTGAGAHVKVAGKVDASGKTGGGTVSIGGAAHGADTLAKADTVDVASGAQISADAITNGDGGSIAVWSETTTNSAGAYSAKGGSESGNGGFVETSSSGVLSAGGTLVDTSAANGSFGKWLLDPYNLTVDSALASSVNSSNTSVLLYASNDLTVAADINMVKSGAGLTLYTTYGDINIQNQDIKLNGGDFSIDAGNNIKITHSDIITKGGNVDIYSYDGNLTLNNSNINTSGGTTNASVTFLEGVYSRNNKNFGQVFNTANSTLTTQGKAGNVKLSANNISGNSVCIAAGGTGCGGAPAPITLAIKGDNKYITYGQMDPALTYTVSAGALMSGDSFTGGLVRVAGNNVGTYAINQGTLGVYTSGAYTYIINYTPGVFTINPAFLTITSNDRSKTYGDSLSLGTTGFTTSGLVSGDSVTGVTLSSTGAGAAADAGTYAVKGTGATGTGLSNYTITYQDGTLTVNKANLTVTSTDTSKVYGQTFGFQNVPTPTATFSGLKNGDYVTGWSTSYGAGAADNASVGNYAITSNIFGIAKAAGFASSTSNYNVTYVNGTLHVTPAALTITASNQSKTYGDLLNLGTTGFTSSGLAAWDNISGVTLQSAGAAATASKGTYSIDASNATGTGLSNYTINYAAGSLLVSPALLTITANNQTKVYGDAMNYNNGGFYTVSGLKNSDTVDTTNGQVMGGFQPTADVGTYDINVYGATGQGLSNYDISFVKGTLTVTPAALTVTSTDTTKVYGQAFGFQNVPNPTATFSGLKNGDYVSSWSTYYGAGSAANTPVGNYAITSNVGSLVKADGHTSSLSNYSITYINGTMHVTPAVLTITANNQSKTYGDLLNLGTSAFTSSGLASWDNISGVNLQSAGAAATANKGTYAITASNATGTGLSNYTINYAAGSLLVNPALLTITANDRSKTYGDNLSLGTTGFTSAGLKNSDNVTGVTLTSNGTAAIRGVGTYDITAKNAVGSGLSNYNITYVKGHLTVVPAVLTITARDQYKVYGDSKNVDNALLGYTVSGLKNFDFVTDVNLASAGGVATANVGDYAITGSGASGLGISNYTINYVDGALHVTPAVLLITADSFSKTYGDTHVFDNTDYGVYGLKNSDTVTGVDMASAGAAGTANVGLYGIFASNATGTGLSNYIIGYTPGLMLVNPAALTITANNQTKTYGDNLALGTSAFTAAGLKNSDAVNGVTLASSGAAGTANVGTYGIAASNATGSGLSNYVITYVGGNLYVTPAALTITALDQSKTYGSTLNLGTTAFMAAGLKNSDAVSDVTLSSAGAAGTANAGSYGIVGSNAAGTGLSNYDITYVNGTLTVDKALLSVIADNQTKTVGQTFVFNGTEFTTLGTLYNGDTVTGATLTSPGAAGTASDLFSPYNIYISNATGTGLSNYNITYVNGLMTVNPIGYNPNQTIASLNRPILSVANKVIVNDSTFEAIETRTLDTDVALRYRGSTTATNTGNAANVLSSLEPAAGGDVSASDLANLEPAAGGDDNASAEDLANLEPAAGGDIACANDFLDNKPCANPQGGVQ